MKKLTVEQADTIAHTRDFLSSLFVLLNGLSLFCEERNEDELSSAMFELGDGAFKYKKKLEEILS